VNNEATKRTNGSNLHTVSVPAGEMDVHNIHHCTCGFPFCLCGFFEFRGHGVDRRVYNFSERIEITGSVEIYDTKGNYSHTEYRETL